MIEKYIALPRISITICFLGIHEIQQCPVICVRKKNFNSSPIVDEVLLMEEILRHLGCVKSC